MTAVREDLELKRIEADIEQMRASVEHMRTQNERLQQQINWHPMVLLTGAVLAGAAVAKLFN